MIYIQKIFAYLDEIQYVHNNISDKKHYEYTEIHPTVPR